MQALILAAQEVGVVAAERTEASKRGLIEDSEDQRADEDEEATDEREERIYDEGEIIDVRDFPPGPGFNC